MDHDSGRHDDRAVSLALAADHLIGTGVATRPAVRDPVAEALARIRAATPDRFEMALLGGKAVSDSELSSLPF